MQGATRACSQQEAAMEPAFQPAAKRRKSVRQVDVPSMAEPSAKGARGQRVSAGATPRACQGRPAVRATAPIHGHAAGQKLPPMPHVKVNGPAGSRQKPTPESPAQGVPGFDSSQQQPDLDPRRAHVGRSAQAASINRSQQQPRQQLPMSATRPAPSTSAHAAPGNKESRPRQQQQQYQGPPMQQLGAQAAALESTEGMHGEALPLRSSRSIQAQPTIGTAQSVAGTSEAMRHGSHGQAAGSLGTTGSPCDGPAGSPRASTTGSPHSVRPKITWVNPLKRTPLASQKPAADGAQDTEAQSPSEVAPMDIDSPAIGPPQPASDGASADVSGSRQDAAFVGHRGNTVPPASMGHPVEATANVQHSWHAAASVREGLAQEAEAGQDAEAGLSSTSLSQGK